MIQKTKSLIYSITLLLTFTACEKEIPAVVNQEELITDVVYELKDPAGNTKLLKVSDPDGEGGNAPVVTSDILNKNTSYTGSIKLSNSSISPVEDITSEIKEEALEHQFFYQISGLDMTIKYADMDEEGKPIGLKTTLVTGNTTSTGVLKVSLKHQPDKSATGVSDGLIANAGGETDLEISFNVEIK